MGMNIVINEGIIEDTSLRIKVTLKKSMTEFDTISAIGKLLTLVNGFKEIHLLIECRDSSTDMNLFSKSRIVNFIQTLRLPLVECVFLLRSLNSANENKSYFEAINNMDNVNTRFTTDPQLANSWLVNAPLVLPVAC